MKHELSRNNNYDFFEEAMHDFFPAFYGYSDKRAQKYMRTDIKETDDSYLMEVEIPGADKKDIRLDLNDGYLNISVSKNEKEEGGKKDNYIRRERSFSCSRSYYVGDVKKDAVVTALAALWGNLPYYVAWQIKDGVVQSPVFGTITPSNPPSSVIYGCVSPVSADLSDGLVFIGYAGAPYALYYCADPTGEKSWNTVYDTGTAGNENYNSISIAEFDGRKYCAIGEDNHFGYTNPTVYLVDITDMSDVELVYKGSIPGVFASVAAMDLKLVPEGDVLKIYIVDAGYDTAGCIELPRQEGI